MKLKNLTLILGAIFFLSTLSFAQADGELDLSFGTNGSVIFGLNTNDLDTFQDVVVQDDDKIVAVGMSWDSGFVARAKAMRYNSDGSVDTSFGDNGTFSYALGFEALIYGCAITSEGKIVLAGATTDYQKYDILLIQLNADGTLDSGFGTNGVVVQQVSTAEGYYEDFAYGVTIDMNGNILIAGSSYNDDYNRRPVIIRFTSTGELDTSFGTNGVAEVPVVESSNDFKCLAIQPDGKILAAGTYSPEFLWNVMLITRFNADGSVDTSFGTNGVTTYNHGGVDDRAWNMALTPEGNIVVSGFSATANFQYGALLVQFTSDGVLDANFGTNGAVNENQEPFNEGGDLLVQEDGQIVMAGDTGQGPPNAYDYSVWKYNPDGSRDMDFGVNGQAREQISGYNVMLKGVALQSDGKIISVGQARSTMNNNEFVMIRLGNTVEEVNQEPQFTATITITDDVTMLPLENVSVFLDGMSLTTDANGQVTFANLEDGTYDYSYSLACYLDGFGSITISGGNVVETAEMTANTTNSLFFFVGSPLTLPGATVTLFNNDGFTETLITGNFLGDIFENVPYGEYSYIIEAPCYETISGTVTVDCNGGDGNFVEANPVATATTNSVFFFVGSPLTLDGALVTLFNNDGYFETLVTGNFLGDIFENVPFGEYSYTIEAQCYDTITGTVTVDCNEGNGNIVEAIPVESTTNSVFFFVGDLLTINGLTVTLSDGMDYNETLTTGGILGDVFEGVPYGDYTYTIEGPCYETITGSVIVDCNGGTGNSVEAVPVENTTNSLFFFIGDPLTINGATVTLSDGMDYNETLTTGAILGDVFEGVPYGEYTYTVEANCYETVTGTVTVDCNGGDGNIVAEDPMPITLDNTVTEDGNTLTAAAVDVSYQWVDCDNGNAEIEGETGQSFTATEDGNYAVVISTDNCTATSECTSVTVTGIFNTVSNMDISVYPNPFQSNLNIQLGAASGTTAVELLSITGQSVLRKNFTNTELITLSISDLASGTYLLRVSNDNGSFASPIIKQ